MVGRVLWWVWVWGGGLGEVGARVTRVVEGMLQQTASGAADLKDIGLGVRG
jgi:hypothetical protein